jgi:hypothetical protein
MNIVRACQQIALIALCLILSTLGCEDDEINEASEAFRNCAGSSEDTIYRRVQEEKEEDRPNTICNIIDSAYSGCNAQKTALERCKGAQDVARIIEARLYSIREILRLTYAYQNIKVSNCNIFNQPKIDVTSKKPVPPSSRTKVNRNVKDENSRKHMEKVSQDMSHDNSAASGLFIAPHSLFLYVIIFSYHFCLF